MLLRAYRAGQPLSSVSSLHPLDGQRVFTPVFSLPSDGDRRTSRRSVTGEAAAAIAAAALLAELRQGWSQAPAARGLARGESPVVVVRISVRVPVRVLVRPLLL